MGMISWLLVILVLHKKQISMQRMKRIPEIKNNFIETTLLLFIFKSDENNLNAVFLKLFVSDNYFMLKYLSVSFRSLIQLLFIVVEFGNKEFFGHNKIGHRKWFHPFLISKFDCTSQLFTWENNLT